MFFRPLLVMLLVTATSGVSAADRTPWYEKDPKPATLRAAFAEDMRFLGADNPGYRMVAGGALCEALRKVKLPCDYNARSSLSMFLAVNGKGLFPAAGGTNPYHNPPKAGDPRPDDGYIGRSVQNKMMLEALRRNAHLFKNGDLTASAVKTRWR